MVNGMANLLTSDDKFIGAEDNIATDVTDAHSDYLSSTPQPALFTCNSAKKEFKFPASWYNMTLLFTETQDVCAYACDWKIKGE